MVNRQRMLGVLAILLAWALLPMPVAAADTPQTGLTMDATAAFGGHFKYGEWLPIWVQVENQGTALEAEIQVEVTSRSGAIIYAAPVSLPSGARKRVPLYVAPNSFSHELEVWLVDASDRSGKQPVLLREEVEVEPLPNIHYLVGLITPDRGALSLLVGVTLPGRERSKTLVDLTLEELPERIEGLRSFDLLILNDVDTSTLTPDQGVVLEAWVRQGGRLVIGGGANALVTVSGLPRALLPLLPNRTNEVADLPALASFAGGAPVRVPGPFVIATGTESKGKILAQQGDLPLVVDMALGNGHVDYVAVDLATAPFDAWSGTTSFWETLVGPGANYPEWMPPDMSPWRSQLDQMNYALSRLPSLDLPSVRGLTVLLAIYILLVGPVNYLLLRYFRRLHWAWITIPVLTIVFSAGAFGLGYALRGTDLILNKIAIVELVPDGSANVSSYMGLFSPAQQSYEIEVAGEGLLSPVIRNADPWGPVDTGGGNMVIVQGTPNRLRGLSVNQWSMQTFMTQDHWQDVGEIQTDFRIEDSTLVGEIYNSTPYPLHDATIVLGENFSHVGELPQGETVQVSMPLTHTADWQPGVPLTWRMFEAHYNGRLGPPPLAIELKRTILENLYQYYTTLSAAGGGTDLLEGRVLLLAWMDQAPPEVEVAGRVPVQQTTALLYADYPYRLPDVGEVALPPGLLPGQLIQMPVEGGICGPNIHNSVYIARGEAIFEFSIPESIWDVRVDTLKIFVGTDGRMALPNVALYNWDTDTWLELDDPQLGVNSLAYAPGMMRDERIRVRLSMPAEQQGACTYVEMGLDGRRGTEEATVDRD